MRWIRPLSGQVEETPELLGGKAYGLVVLQRLGLPVPPGFVVTTEACREFLRTGRPPAGLGRELAAAIRDLEAASGLRFGGSPPLTVSVRSGAPVSMPGMMNTVLDLGLDAEDPAAQLRPAIEAVFSSWNSARARTFRALRDIPHHLGTAAIVQVMVFGDRDQHSGAGVAFSRDPDTGEHLPFGEVLFGHQGEDVVSGSTSTEPLSALAEREPAVWNALLDALTRIEARFRDACYVEFTFQSGELWMLQVRPGGYVGSAAIRVATELADQRVISRSEALLRVTAHDLERAGTARISTAGGVEILTRGIGACPGVAVGRIATTVQAAVRLASDGPVVLVRPETSPYDMQGLAVAEGILTTRGGPASHAAVVARSLGKPAVVGAGAITVEDRNAAVRVAGRRIAEGTVITLDGTSGAVALGTPELVTNEAGTRLRRLLGWADEVSGDRSERDDARRLEAAQALLRTDR